MTIKYTGRFKKDLKRYKNDAVKVKALATIVKCLS